MKKLLISIGVALGLLGASVPVSAQSTPTRPSVKNYFFQSKVGSFVDLSTLENPHFRLELGANLEKGTALKDVFFVADADKLTGDALTAGMFKTVTLTDAASDAAERTQPAIPSKFLGKAAGFPFLGADMQGFAVAALGGILFADGETPTVNCQDVSDWKNRPLESNFARVYPSNSNGDISNPTKGDKAPVVIVAATDAIGFFVGAQFDYMVEDARWLYQIRCYENGRIDYITGNDLRQSGLAADAKGYAFAPAAVQNASNIALIGPGHPSSSAIPQPHCWDVIKMITNLAYLEEGLKVSPDCGPETGRTVSLLPPFDANAFSLTDPTIEATQIEGKVILNLNKTPIVAAEIVNSFCLSITTADNQGFSEYGFSSDKEPEPFKNDWNRVVTVEKPSDWTSNIEIPFVADELKTNTEYYIHVVLGKYTPGASSAYSYTKLASFGPYTPVERPSSVAAIENLTTSINDGMVNATFMPVEGMSTMVVKSPNATPQTPSGKLVVGDLIGSSYDVQDTVAAILNTGIATAELPIEAGEGFYLHLYAVYGPESNQAVYSHPTTSVVYRPAESLPLEWTLTAKTNPKTLPIGWSHSAFVDTENDYADAAFAFKYVDTYVLTSLNKTLVNGNMQADVILPAFISPEDNVTTMFNVKFFDYVDGWQYVARTPAAGDSVRIDYRLDGGEWQVGKRFVTSEFPDADKNTGIITLYTTISGTKNRLVEIRYTRYTATANTANTIVSTQISREITCFPPKALAIDTAGVTDTQITLKWDDTENQTASYVIAFQTKEQADEWETVPATEKTGKLTGLTPNTSYRMQVQAVCAADEASAFSTPIAFTTYSGLPYTETLGEVVTAPTSPYTEWPSDRGVTTYTGKIGGVLKSENNATYTWSLNNSSSYKRGDDLSLAMGIHEDTKDGVLMSPRIYVAVPTKLTFTLNSFSAKKDENYVAHVVPGATPTEADCQLHVAVSNNGEFTMDDIVLTLKGSELNVVNKDFELEVTKTGLLQIAFFFDNPATHWEDDFYIETQDLGLRSAVAPQFDLTLNVQPDAEAGTVTGAGQYEEGSNVTVTATPAEGYDFVTWMNGSAELSKEATYTFTMPAEDITYTALFKAQPVELEDYELTLTASPSNGGRVSGDGIYTEGEEVTISAEANQGFVFVAWLNADNDTLSKEATYTFKMPAKDTAFMARFMAETANEDLLRANFGLSTQDGRLIIRNRDGLTVKSVDVYGLTGNRINRFTPNSREDLTLPVDARRAMLFVRLKTERGAVIYKVYMH